MSLIYLFLLLYFHCYSFLFPTIAPELIHLYHKMQTSYTLYEYTKYGRQETIYLALVRA